MNTGQDTERTTTKGEPMDKKEREIRKLLRTQEQIVCLNAGGYITTLAISLRMPIGSVKAKIVKGYQPAVEQLAA